MRHTVSKRIPNHCAGLLSPPRLSYRSNKTPSGWYSLPVNICPVRSCPSNPFFHLRRPRYHMLLSHNCSTAVYIPISPHLCHHAHPSLSSPLTLSSISIILHLRRTYIFILWRLCCGPYHIIFHRSVYFAAVVSLPSLIGFSPCYASFCTTLLDPLCSTLLFLLSALIF